MSKPVLTVLVRFKSALSADEVIRIAEERAPEFEALTGLLQKYYLQDAATGEFAGFYLWESQKDFTDFRDSALRKSIAETYKTEGAPRIEVYRVMKTLRDENA